MRFLTLAALMITLSACGGNAPAPAVPTPTPTLDRWQVLTCERLAAVDPASDWLVADIVAGFAEQSTDPAFVDLGIKTKQTKSTGLLRGWCHRNYPKAGVRLSEPSG